ncbi:MAG: hypothetical protein VKK97_11725 [Synechococcaceae cyanobacterium]|jgi:hypothetical protein|nr:hypothetical protein [Synechococcaceae cyanobacterium]
MIVLKVTNSSEFLASKVGRFLARMTPESVETHAIEAVLINKLMENLAAEGLSGVVASVHGLDFDGTKLVLEDRLHVQSHHKF